MWKMASKALPIELRKKVTQDPMSPLDVLQLLVVNRFPLSKVDLIVQENESRILKMIETNPEMANAILETFSKDSDQLVRIAVARNQSTPDFVLDALSKDDSLYVRMEVADNPRTPSSSLEMLAQDPRDSNSIIKKIILSNPRTPVYLLDKFSTSEDFFFDYFREISNNYMGVNDSKLTYFREIVSQNTSLSIFNLEILSKDLDNNVRLGVAKNTSTPIQVLQTLSNDLEIDVRIAVAGNQKTPIDVLLALAEDPAWQLQDAVAFNSSAPSKVRNEYIEKWLIRIERAISIEIILKEGHPSTARVPITPAAILRALGWLGYFSKDNDNKSLTKASRSKDWLIRLGAALHPHATKGIIDLLAHDSDKDVNIAANLKSYEAT